MHEKTNYLKSYYNFLHLDYSLVLINQLTLKSHQILKLILRKNFRSRTKRIVNDRSFIKTMKLVNIESKTFLVSSMKLVFLTY